MTRQATPEEEGLASGERHPKDFPVGLFFNEPELVVSFGFLWFASAADLLFALRHDLSENEETPTKLKELVEHLSESTNEPELSDELLEKLSPYLAIDIQWWGHVDALLEGEAGEAFRENFREEDEDPDGAPPIPPEQRGEFLDYLSEYGN
jgi:hypothetical protein